MEKRLDLVEHSSAHDAQTMTPPSLPATIQAFVFSLPPNLRSPVLLLAVDQADPGPVLCSKICVGNLRL